jgi:hypothetical protein
MFGFSAILLPQLQEENVLQAKSEEASWIGENLFSFSSSFSLATYEPFFFFLSLSVYLSGCRYVSCFCISSLCFILSLYLSLSHLSISLSLPLTAYLSFTQPQPLLKSCLVFISTSIFTF